MDLCMYLCTGMYVCMYVFMYRYVCTSIKKDDLPAFSPILLAGIRVWEV